MVAVLLQQSLQRHGLALCFVFNLDSKPWSAAFCVGLQFLEGRERDHFNYRGAHRVRMPCMREDWLALLCLAAHMKGLCRGLQKISMRFRMMAKRSSTGLKSSMCPGACTASPPADVVLSSFS